MNIFHPDNRVYLNNLDIWEPEVNILIIGNPRNYLKRLRIKQKLTARTIEYYKREIDNPDYTTATKEYIFIPVLKRALNSQKTFEKQGSLLAA